MTEPSRQPAGARNALVVDFDGTLTERDTLELLVAEFGDPTLRRRVEHELGRGVTLDEAIAQQYASLSRPLAEVSGWLLENVRLRPGSHALVEWARTNRWRFVIVSSGLRELIQPVLAQAGLGAVELYANALRGDPPPWVVRFRECGRCATCFQTCKRSTVQALEARAVVYVGDGFSDVCVAESADRVFARRRLAAHFARRNLAFEPFDDMFDVVAALESA